jgi:hypothetical protein
MIKGKAPEEIRRTFNIKNDFTPQEVLIFFISQYIKKTIFHLLGRTNQKRKRMVRRKIKQSSII